MVGLDNLNALRLLVVLTGCNSSEHFPEAMSPNLNHFASRSLRVVFENARASKLELPSDQNTHDYSTCPQQVSPGVIDFQINLSLVLTPPCGCRGCSTSTLTII